jgi:hypothetical protein
LGFTWIFVFADPGSSTLPLLVVDDGLEEEEEAFLDYLDFEDGGFC